MGQTSSSNPKSGLSKNLKIGVLFGGISSERKISLRSGRAVKRAIAAKGFRTLWLDPAKRNHLEKGLKKIDIAFVALHGRGGEDGWIQRLLERRRVCYVGSNPAASRRAFDKSIAKKIFVKAGIPTPAYAIVKLTDRWEKLARFPTPFFVKPLREGSSIGAFSVEDFDRDAVKIKQGLEKYGALLVEEKVIGREFTVGILGDRPLPVIEVAPKRSFYDFRAKYTKGMTEYLVPAPISRPFAARLERLALKVHKTLGLRDFSRVDMMADAKGRPYVLEANSIPGFTELSLLPKAARQAGISFGELCMRLVTLALARKRKASHGGKKA